MNSRSGFKNKLGPLGSVRLVAALACFAGLPLPGQPWAELLSRKQVANNIYETVYSLRTGRGEHDRFQLHRVVRENGRGPVETRKVIMLVHGDAWGFNPAFMPAGSGADSLPVYLASQGADVWGVDLAWTLVPESTAEFEFMRRWGLQHDIDEVDAAIDAAQRVRRDRTPFAVLGFSRGAWILYGLLNQETALPCARRKVKGAIPFDGGMKFLDEGARANACGAASFLSGELTAGRFAQSNTIWRISGDAAANDPNGPSVTLPPQLNLTNRQGLIFVGAALFNLTGPSFSPQYHFAAGVFPNDDVSQFPTGFAYSDETRFISFARSVSPYQPTRLLQETSQVACEPGLTGRFDRRLGAVQIPILAVGARGGFDASAFSTLPFLGSTDVEELYVALKPDKAQGLDFGHWDLLNARNAQGLVWSGIDRWLTVHASDPVCRP